MVAAAQFLTFVAVAAWWFPDWLRNTRELLRTSLVGAFQSELTANTFPAIVTALLTAAFKPVAVVALSALAASLGTHLAITGLGFSLEKLTPDFTRFNPISKIKNLAQEGPVSALQAAAMLIVFSAAIIAVVRQNAELFFTLPYTSLELGLTKIGQSIKDVAMKAAAVFVLFGLIDLFRQKRRYMNDLKMTKQEVKEELKEAEGSPHVKGKIRRMQRDAARRRMMQQVATATAVIVNPTHYAVALRYDHAEMATPIVVAKGKNYLAQKIRERALQHGVPLVENPPLARALYGSVDVGREIPPHLFRAVAEILAYIYRLSSRRR